MAQLTATVFKNLYQSNFTSVRLYIYAKSGNLVLAEDIAQEAFVRLWSNANKVETEKAKSFVFTVANNLFIDHIRHEKVKNQYKKITINWKENLDPQYIMEMDEFKQQLELMIESMPENARIVFLLNRIEKMTYQQIADSLQLSIKAIEKRMNKALSIIADFTHIKI